MFDLEQSTISNLVHKKRLWNNRNPVRSKSKDWVWLGLDLRDFQQYFSYIMMVSFIGGVNRGNLRKPPTYRNSLTNFITTFYRVHLIWVGFELTALVVIDIDCIGRHKSNYHTITTTTTPKIGKPNNLKVFGCKITKRNKEDSQNWLRLPN